MVRPAQPRSPRRPARLPRRVYWWRRLLVLCGTAALVGAIVLGVAGLARLRGEGPPADQAQQVAGTPTASSSSPPASGLPAASASSAPSSSPGRHRLPRPQGVCSDDDIVVTPAVSEAHAGGEVVIVLEVGTADSVACTWQVSPESVFLTIASETGLVWSSQQCPHAVPTQRVVARRERVDTVEVVWHGQESDEGCSLSAPWVLPGVYTATAVARGAVTPVDTGFALGDAVAPTVTVTPTPTSTTTPSPTQTGTTAPTADTGASSR